MVIVMGEMQMNLMLMMRGFPHHFKMRVKVKGGILQILKILNMKCIGTMHNREKGVKIVLIIIKFCKMGNL